MRACAEYWKAQGFPAKEVACYQMAFNDDYFWA